MSETQGSITEDFISCIKSFCDYDKVSWNEDVPEGTDYKQTQRVEDIVYNLSVQLHP